jgi:hypothetical protein
MVEPAGVTITVVPASVPGKPSANRVGCRSIGPLERLGDLSTPTPRQDRSEPSRNQPLPETPGPCVITGTGQGDGLLWRIATRGWNDGDAQPRTRCTPTGLL